MDLTAGTKSLPLWAQVPTSAVLVLVLLLALRITDTVSGRFVVFACWLRFMLSAYHQYTYDPLVAGVSGSAIGSAALFALGLALLRRSLLLHKAVLAVYAVIASILLSGLANGTVADAFDPLMKMGLFLVIALNSYEALRSGDPRRFGIGSILSFSPLLVFQVVSVVLGVAKSTEDSGARSYVGGYDHESPFSVALVALLVVAAVASRVPLRWRVPAAILSIIGIILANYRTAILAMAPLLLYLLLTNFAKLFDRRMRPLVTTVIGGLLLVSAAFSLLTLERFSDFRTIIQSDEPIIKPPNEFTFEEARLFSGRTSLWSQYYYHWKDNGGSLQHMIGFGPDSWIRYFTIYAHNTFVDTLFEYGLIGLVALIFLFGTGIAAALRSGPNRWKLVSAHLSFVILNLATMPMWLVEGLILYGLLWGYTIFARFDRAEVRRPAQRTPWRPVVV